MTESERDSVALVTNVTDFAGPAAVEALVTAGFRVFAHDKAFVDPEVWNRFASKHPGAECVSVTDPAALVTKAWATAGRVDVIVSNDHYPAIRTASEAASLEDLRQTLEALVLKPFSLVRSAIPLLKAQSGGSIVMITSCRTRLPLAGAAIPDAARAAANALVRSLAVELAPFEIAVNAIAPNFLYSEAYYPRATFIEDERGPGVHPIRRSDEAPGSAGGNGRAHPLSSAVPSQILNRCDPRLCGSMAGFAGATRAMIRSTRRPTPTICSIAFSMVLSICGVMDVRAAAPMVKTQPGFYRLMLGDFEITALNDGVVAYPIKRVLPVATPEQIAEALSESTSTDPVGLSYNAFLINTGTKLVLIDTGTGGKLDDQPEFHGAGHLVANLRAAGYQPEQVDEVYITHRGQDHIGGLTIGRERAFPNALVRASKSEFDMFLDPGKSARLLAEANNDEKVRAWLDFTQDLFAPYIKAGKFQAFDADTSLVPGIRALATHGHTPGHTAYVVESRGKTLIVMGDLVLMAPLQFAYPLLGSAFDADAKAAAEQRLRVFKTAAESGHLLAGGHLPFPGIGHVRAAEGRYFWIPATYQLPQ